MKAGAKDSPDSELETPPADLVKKALATGLAFEGLLAEAAIEGSNFRLRLARAHALSAIDALTELVQQRARGEAPASSHSGVYTMVETEGRLVKKL